MKPRAAAAAFVLLLLTGPGGRPLRAEAGPADLEEAAEVARRSAGDLLHSSAARLFSEALDADGILARRLGARAWSSLADRQREQLRAGVRERFVRTLAVPRTQGDIAWSTARADGDGVDVFIGLRLSGRVLKTRWVMHRAGSGWKIGDVVLVDPGVSIARAAEQSLGPRPVERRTAGEEFWSNAAPRAGAMAVIALLTAAIAARIRREWRRLLYLTAAAPLALLAIDGVLAVRRALLEPYVVSQGAREERWRKFEQMAFAAEREGRAEEAREHWIRALSAGGPPGPIEYQIGLAARAHGDAEGARAALERALAAPEPAPGADKELAAIDAAAGRFAEADARLRRYLAAAGPDPDSLSIRAVVQTNLEKNADALETVREARALVGEGWKGQLLEAQIRARAGDAAGCVAALRGLESEGVLDRSLLRSDPLYLPIATDPAWVAFLNERPKESRTRSRS
ncbi:MAG: hypothetical protein ABI592_11935 [Acidobacteriota bacterium]